MFKELINKLKKKKQRLQDLTDTQSEKASFNISISKEYGIYKIEVSDYVSIIDYADYVKLIDKYGITEKISNGVLWNSRKQKVNKGTYYVLIVENRLYNILVNDNDFILDERTQIENITEERILEFNTNSGDYHYFSAKHDKTGNTFYTRYYSKKRLDLGKLNFSKEEAYEEVNNVISNLSNIGEITEIIDTNLLEINILNDIDTEYFQKRYFKNKNISDL